MLFERETPLGAENERLLVAQNKALQELVLSRDLEISGMVAQLAYLERQIEVCRRVSQDQAQSFEELKEQFRLMKEGENDK